MTVRFASRLLLLVAGLLLATTSVLGAPAALATPTKTGDTLLDRDQAGAVERAVETGDGAASASSRSPTPAVVLVFAGIVLLAALPPVQHVHVYHRPYHRSDWR
jgi:hypothetical protein